MALSIQAGTGSEGLVCCCCCCCCCWVSGCERRAEEEEEEEEGGGKEGLDMDARLGAKGVLEEVEIFDAGTLLVDEFPCDFTDRVGC